MALYLISGLVLESEIELPELPTAPTGPPDMGWRISSEPRPSPDGGEWLYQWDSVDGTPWCSTGRVGKQWLLRYPEHGDFLISEDQREVICYPTSSTPVETLRHLYVDQVFPLQLSHSGRLVLHASSLALPANAEQGDSWNVLALAGESGAGKSTLVASLCQRGGRLITDDALLLEETAQGWLAIPHYASFRLWDDSASRLEWDTQQLPTVAHYSRKKRVGAAVGNIRMETQKLALSRIILLQPRKNVDTELAGSDAVHLEPISARDALLELTPCTYRLDASDRAHMRRELEQLGRLVTAVPSYRLTFPHDFQLLEKVQEAVLSAPAHS